MKKIKIAFLAFLLIFVTGCSKKEAKVERYTSQFYETFDTVVDVTIYSDDENFAIENLKYTEDRFKELSMLFDNYKSYPNLANVKTINENAGIKPVVVDDVLYELIKESIDNYHNYSKKNNIALGPVIDTWNAYRDLYDEGRTKEEVKAVTGSYIPDKEMLEGFKNDLNVDNIKLDDEEKSVYIDSGMKIDLGATAKGYATELVAKELEERGVKSCIISAGGNVRVIGEPGDGRDTYKIGIQNPDLSSSNKAIAVMRLKGDVAAVTSGDYQRFFEVDGVRYPHIIDPDTLEPSHRIKSLTVINKDSALADFLSTAGFNSTNEEIEKLSILTDSGIIWVDEKGDLHYTKNAEEYLEK
ncbi:FAD:protein FMN transferase [Peptoniphilus sp.]|jgi:thiamine biosynthesis lipoprotein|uniref:FAD:protein FMN transferase n=1 Tax=Peptoniphilus sp. TaxID=1971214 RepID=UPI003D8FA40D